MRLLLLEDDLDLAPVLRTALERRDIVVDLVGTLAEAREALASGNPYAVALLDRRVPDGDGIDLLADIQSLREPPATILLTALDEVADRVRGLDRGADDYLAKPFDMGELLARIRAVQRRHRPAEAKETTVGGLTFDFINREARVGGETLALPRRELAALELLMHRAGRVVTREALEAAVWSFDDEVRADAIEPHLSRLRRRLVDRGAGVVIHALRGVGYLLKAE
jgi:DNA-binding response OmpR family regulator